MRKIIAIIILIFSLSILLLAMNQSLINRIKQDRYFDHLDHPVKTSIYQKIFLRSDTWEYGDLYGISFMHPYKIKLIPFKKYHQNATHVATNKILYIIGDSFLADKILDGAFNEFDNVIFLDRRFGFGPINLDSTKKNYLIMEFAEMNIINYSLHKTNEVLWSADNIKNKVNYSNKSIGNLSPAALPTGFSRIGNILFNKDLSRNIETIIFGDKIFTPFKELKASINYNLLGRLPKEVAVSTDKKRLLLNSTVDTSYNTSDFRPLSNQALDSIQFNLDEAGAYYKSIGFYKIYLAIIPNAASIYDSKRMPYNHLAEKVQKKTSLPAIDIYTTFLAYKENLYSRSDTHWNTTGFELWVSKANSVLDTAK
jgi:hypothetical protein